MDKGEKKRTNAQRKALELYCKQMADLCVEHGLTLPVIIEKLEVYPTQASIKDILRAIGKTKNNNKESTADWTTQELQEVFKEFHEFMVRKTNGMIDIPFPSVTNTVEYLTELEKEYETKNIKM